MGVWNVVESWLGGRPKLTVELEADRVAIGGLVAGQITVASGRRGVELDGVRVCLLRTAVRSRDGSPTGDIVQKTVVDAMVGSGLRLQARTGEAVDFAIRVPPDAEPSNEQTSYRIRVQVRDADGKGPKLQRAIRIVDAALARPELDAIENRWPALAAETSGDATADALRELRFVHDPDDAANDFVAAEPRLAELLMAPTPAVRDAAIDAYGDILAGRGGPPHVGRLRAALDAGRPEAERAKLVTTAARIGGDHAMALLTAQAEHTDATVRRAVAQAVTTLSAGDGAKRELLQSMTRDEDPGVRAGALRGLGDFVSDPAVVEAVAAHTTTEPASVVVEACVQTLALALHPEDAIVRPVFERLVAHPQSRVRAAVARSLHAGRSEPWVAVLVGQLLDDDDADVRAQTSAELRRYGAAAEPFLGRLEQLARVDDDPEVRGAALSSLPGLLRAGDLVDFLSEIVDADPPPAVVRGVLAGIKHHPDPAYATLVDELADHPDKRLSQLARELL